ncbi:MAG: hypothetical protein QNJ11_18215 [Woeseiaceae bacterium]|nr:hypothetical protein [Woeseiaceae bacterium]
MRQVVLPLFVLLASCVPMVTVTQPEVEIVVTDGLGAPIADAIVNFASQLYGPDGSTDFVKIRTDQSGVARLDRKSYIQFAVLIVDGVASYGWSYCIEKAGFEPAVRNHLDKKYFKDSLVRVSLARSDSVGSCTWNEDWRGDFYSAATR